MTTRVYIVRAYDKDGYLVHEEPAETDWEVCVLHDSFAWDGYRVEIHPYRSESCTS